MMRPLVPLNGSFGGYYLGNPRYIIEAWNSGVMDTLRNRLIIFGGGHADYTGNEVYAFNLNTLAWSRLTNPGLPPTNSGGCKEGIVPIDPGGTQANARHTYDGIEYMANVDKMFVFGGSLSWCGFAGTGTWAFDFATNTWERKNPSGPIPYPDYGILTAYDSNTGKVFLHDRHHFFAYTYSTNSWAKLVDETFLNGVDYHLTATIDPVKKKWVAFGGGQGWIYDISVGSTYSRQALPTTGGTAIVNAASPGLAYDPVSAKIIGWAGGGTVYSLDLGTKVWTPITNTGGGPGASPAQGTFGHWQYSTTSGVFVGITSIDASLFALRLAAGSPPPLDITPPTVSITAPADGATVACIVTLTANASDNIGVVGVQFKLDGVNLGAEDLTAPYSVPWDTSTFPAGQHVITAVARDLSGNLGSSQPVSVTSVLLVACVLPAPTNVVVQ